MEELKPGYSYILKTKYSNFPHIVKGEVLEITEKTVLIKFEYNDKPIRYEISEFPKKWEILEHLGYKS